MIQIKKLPPHLIAQIAAGEVIERPSYAVKELIDNAIDAKTTEISIHLENYGLKKITVIDNGIGMPKEDLLESYKIHTTSKVEDENSLTAISSMGFRGEALASIAAVSRLIIKSRTAKDTAGHQIEVNNGKFISERPVGMPKGTSIEIENIFSELPARKKFLKAPPTELRNIIEVFISFALAFPQIRFSLNHNNRVLYDLPITNDLLSRSSMLLGNAVTEQFIPIDKTDSYITISGFLAKPQYTTQSAAKQFLFINNRRVSDKTIFNAIKDSYQTMIPNKKLPVFLIFLKIPFELVDVNVHPRKEQLALFNQQQVYETIAAAVTETLKQFNLIFSGSQKKYIPSTNSATGNILRENTNPWQVKKETIKINYQTVEQLDNLYLSVTTKYGLLIIDQHAAHERILYEQYKTNFEKQKLKSIKIAKPIRLSLGITDKLLLEEYKDEFEKIGFTFDKNLHISDIPVFFKDRNIIKLFKELFEDLEQNSKLNSVDQTSEKIIRFLACKNAIKAGDELTKTESIKLIKQLENTPGNYTCPHGRPTKYLLSLTELNKLFKRN